MIFGHDFAFWITAFGAALIRVFSAEKIHPFRSVFTFCTAIFAAWVFTDAAIELLGLDYDKFKYPVAAIVAITGENAGRALMVATNDLNSIINAIKLWRGR